MIKVYLAARYNRRAEMQEVSLRLAKVGLVVVSSWVRGDHDLNGDERLTDEAARVFAHDDILDISNADIVVAFSEADYGGSGGRHVEVGIALAKGKPVVIIGHCENIFYSLATARFNSIDDFIAAVEEYDRSSRALLDSPVRAVVDPSSGNEFFQAINDYPQEYRPATGPSLAERGEALMPERFRDLPGASRSKKE